MRESRTYGSGRGACDETHVPTATWRGCEIERRTIDIAGAESFYSSEGDLCGAVTRNADTAARVLACCTGRIIPRNRSAVRVMNP